MHDVVWPNYISRYISASEKYLVPEQKPVPVCCIAGVLYSGHSRQRGPRAVNRELRSPTGQLGAKPDIPGIPGKNGIGARIFRIAKSA